MTVMMFGNLTLMIIANEQMSMTTLPNTSKFVKNILLRVVFSTLFSVFGNVVKHGLSYLMYYISLFIPSIVSLIS